MVYLHCRGLSAVDSGCHWPSGLVLGIHSQGTPGSSVLELPIMNVSARRWFQSTLRLCFLALLG